MYAWVDRGVYRFKMFILQYVIHDYLLLKTISAVFLRTSHRVTASTEKVHQQLRDLYYPQVYFLSLSVTHPVFILDICKLYGKIRLMSLTQTLVWPPLVSDI